MPMCERCGKDISDNLTFCPSCGTLISPGRPSMRQPGQSTASPEPTQLANDASASTASQSGKLKGMYTFNSTAFSGAYIPVRSTKNNTPLVVEILLNLLLGLYGVGWLMAGETIVGVILLIGSFFLYWPALIFGIIFTFGLGIFSIGTLALGLIILNAVLLNNYLNRKASRRMRSF